MNKILVFYDYFLPAFKAGGPIQSIANMCRQFKHEYEISIVCGDRDIFGDKRLEGIIINSWNDFENGSAKVFYLTRDQQTKKRITSLIKEVSPDVIFVNGLYSLPFTIYPLLFKGPKKIVSVRGMLHPGALAQKRFKKKLYFPIVKSLRIFEGAAFHATDEAEKNFTLKKFGKNREVFTGQNFPARFYNIDPLPKQKGVLKLLSIALISPIKNIELILKALQYVNFDVEYDLYGPINDKSYWNKCLRVANNISKSVSFKYKGDLLPAKVPSTLSAYHFFVLPSKSENFGHAIYEALAAGKPVITSLFTPWNNLELNNCGYNVDIGNYKNLVLALNKAALMDNTEYINWSRATNKYLSNKTDIQETKEAYRKMFNSYMSK